MNSGAGSTTDTNALIDERETTHGPYTRTAQIAQELKGIIHYRCIGDFVQRETLDMIASKMARILSGNSDCIEHWEDIAGYAQLVVRKLENERLAEFARCLDCGAVDAEFHLPSCRSNTTKAPFIKGYPELTLDTEAQTVGLTSHSMGQPPTGNTVSYGNGGVWLHWPATEDEAPRQAAE